MTFAEVSDPSIGLSQQTETNNVVYESNSRTFSDKTILSFGKNHLKHHYSLKIPSCALVIFPEIKKRPKKARSGKKKYSYDLHRKRHRGHRKILAF